MASFTENMRMANLYPTGNRGGTSPDLWNEIQSKVIPAMGRKRDEEQRMLEHNQMRQRNMAEGREPYEGRSIGALGQIGQQIASGKPVQMAQGQSGNPN